MFNYKVLTTAFALTVIVITLMSANMTKAQVVQEELISYWTFDEADISGDTVKDVFGKNDGIIKGDPEIVEGKFGQALEFDGEGDYVTLGGDVLPFDDNFPFTYTAWIKHAVKVTDNQVFCIIGNAGKRRNFRLDQSKNLQIRGWDDAEHKVSGSTVVDTNWHHAAVTFDGSKAAIYLDGQEDASDSFAYKEKKGGYNDFIGQRSTQWSPRNFFKGLIDEVGIYGKALSKDEVNQIITPTTAVTPADKLAISWGEIKVSR